MTQSGEKGKKDGGTFQSSLLTTAVVDEIKRAGFSNEVAELIAEISVIVVCSTFQGQQVYFPKREMVRYRNRLIYQLSNGKNEEQLALENGLSRSSIRKIVKRWRDAKGVL